MDVQILTVLLGLSALISECFAWDCHREIQFQSNFSIQSWCMTNNYECSLGSLRVNPNVSSLYDASSWQAPEPVDFHVTSYCQTDDKGDNRAGVRFSWKPPADKGASSIKGFQISLEGNLPGPGYRCIVLKLRENITRFVVDYEISGSIYPVRRKQNFVLVLYSLPWTTESVNLYRTFHTSECHNAIAVSSKWDTNLTTIYDEENKTLNVSFPRPPEQFNLTQFVLTILSLNSSVIIPKVRINKTFHVFSSIELGSYVLYLEPYNPHPFEHDLCRCRDDRDRCATCKMSQGFVSLRRGSPRTTVSYNKFGRRKWTTKGFRFRNKKWRRKGQNGDGRGVRAVKQNEGKPNRLLIRVVLPLVLLLFSGLCVAILVAYIFRRRKQSDNCCKTSCSTIDQSPMIAVGNGATKRRLLFLLDVSGTTRSSIQSEFIAIVKGMLGDDIDIRKLTYSRGSPNHLQKSLRRVIKDCEMNSNKPTIDNDCSETSLIESKHSNDIDLKNDGFLQDTEDNVGLLLLVFIDSSISTDVLDSIRRECDSACNGILDYDMACVSRSKSDRACNEIGVPVFAYKEELSTLLNFVRSVLTKHDSVTLTDKCISNAGMTADSLCPVNQSTTDIDDQFVVELRHATGTDGDQWVDWPEGVDMAQGRWIDPAAGRKRYVSSDSGWGASENSFRSTPIGEVGEGSDNSSVQSIPVPEHEREPPSPVRPEFVNANEGIRSSESTTLVRPQPVTFALDSSTSLWRCPSDFSFFPPEELTEPEAETICIDDFVGMSNLSELETVSCCTYQGLNRNEDTLSDGRHSPSMDSLMDMMKAINDGSMNYVGNEAEDSDMFNVVFEAVV